MLAVLTDPQAWVSLFTLTALEIVLGIDNIIFLAIIAGKLPQSQQARARTIGLVLALVSRLALLASINWLSHLTTPLTPEIFGKSFSGRDFVLGLGGLFLMGKSTTEMFEMVEAEVDEKDVKARSFIGTLIQIMLLDIIFSLDSVITAVGMAQHLPVMMAAVVLAVIVMLFASGGIAHFVERHPSMKILALSFLILVGLMLVAEAFGQHIGRGYIYFAMAFSVGVEMINIRFRKQRKITSTGP
jgi:predicted tellurium resistance membrane protein TerC